MTTKEKERERMEQLSNVRCAVCEGLLTRVRVSLGYDRCCDCSDERIRYVQDNWTGSTIVSNGKRNRRRETRKKQVSKRKKRKLPINLLVADAAFNRRGTAICDRSVQPVKVKTFKGPQRIQKAMQLVDGMIDPIVIDCQIGKVWPTPWVDSRSRLSKATGSTKQVPNRKPVPLAKTSKEQQKVDSEKPVSEYHYSGQLDWNEQYVPPPIRPEGYWFERFNCDGLKLVSIETLEK